MAETCFITAMPFLHAGNAAFLYHWLRWLLNVKSGSVPFRPIDCNLRHGYSALVRP
jgi:hypothetical protein